MNEEYNMSQKPVAYLDEGLGVFYWPKEYKKDVGFTPLYRKREWVGLNNKELLDLTSIYSGGPLYCAIEAKLKEKNT